MLKLDEKTHVYTDENGAAIPSVTTILSFGKTRPFAFKKEHADRGTAVHRCIELGASLDEESVDSRVAPYLAQWRRFLRESGYVPRQHEMIVHSKQFGYCGTLDQLGEFDGAKSIVDVKTGSIPETCAVQIAAYLIALCEDMARSPLEFERYCLNLTPTTYKLVHYKREDLRRDFAQFHDALRIWKDANQGVAK